MDNFLTCSTEHSSPDSHRVAKHRPKPNQTKSIEHTEERLRDIKQTILLTRQNIRDSLAISEYDEKKILKK